MGRRLFVGNLPYSASEEDLRNAFGANWQVVDARVVTDRETGRSRGFGFVELDSDEAAAEAIGKMDGAELNGRRMAVREAHDRQSGGGGGGGRRPPRRDDRGGPPVERRGGGGHRSSAPPPRRTSRPPRDFAPPPPPDMMGGDFDDGGKDRRRQRRKKKRERHEPEEW